MENSPLVVLLAQAFVLIGQIVAYIRAKQDNAGTRKEMAVFSQDARTAKDASEWAKTQIETIEVGHYRKLRVMLEEAMTELESCRTKIRSLEESVASLSAKLASRERVDKLNEKKRAREEAPAPETGAVPAPSGEGSVDSLLRQFGVPLNASHEPAAPAAPGRNSSFGRPAR